MSFTENPYATMNLIFDLTQENVKWSCNGCGGTSNVVWGIREPVHVIRRNYNLHLVSSHSRTESSFENWRKVWPHG